MEGLVPVVPSDARRPWPMVRGFQGAPPGDPMEVGDPTGEDERESEAGEAGALSSASMRSGGRCSFSISARRLGGRRHGQLEFYLALFGV